MKSFDTAIASALLGSNQEFPVDFEKAWKWLGFSRKDNAKVSLLECGFVEGIDFLINQELEAPTITGWVNPKPNEKIWLTVDCFKTWGMMARTEQGKQIRTYFLQCEKIAKQEAARQLETNRKIYDELANRISNLEPKPLLALPPVPEIPKRNIARKLVDEQARKTGLQHSYLWNQAYYELEYRFGYPIAKSRAKNKLEKIEADGQLDSLIAVMYLLWGNS
jgi:phage anti-repressor protein